jgi:predicted AAA+ superfamily ATPase
LIASRFTENVWKIDLLQSEFFLLYSKEPGLFRSQAVEKITNESVQIIFIDEIQRVPQLLNEVQFLIDHYPHCRFILTGSSARKLKRGSANLLGGRAMERHLFPYVYGEIKDGFSLDDVLLSGSLPALTGKTAAEKRDILESYIHTYLQEEIRSEGIARNLGGFSRFLDMAASQNGELVNFTAIGRECHLPVRTVQSYYEILEDTLIGFRLEPWRKSLRKRLSAHPKFYLFDLGVTNALCRRLTAGLDSRLRGRLFEHFIILETYRTLQYARSEARPFFWRTNNGAEVDLILEKHGKLVAACEIKSSAVIDGSHLTGLRSFQEEHPDVPGSVISQTANAYAIGNIRVYPWERYLEELPTWIA